MGKQTPGDGEWRTDMQGILRFAAWLRELKPGEARGGLGMSAATGLVVNLDQWYREAVAGTA
jgi:hypothetical protein